MKHSTERILTTHVGALHRPPDLEAMMRERVYGEAYDEQAFEDRLRSAVAEVVQHQVDLGIDVIDDGELGKSSFIRYANKRLTNIEPRSPEPSRRSVGLGRDRQDFAQFFADVEPDGYSSPTSRTSWIPEGSSYEPPVISACVGPVQYCSDEVQRDIDNFKAALEGVTVEEAFLPVAGPIMIASSIANEYYPDDETYYAAVADAMKHEYEAIVGAGFTLQLDELGLRTMHTRIVGTEGMEAFRKWAEMAIAATNQALENIPPEQVRLHLCWGGQNHPHRDDPPLRDFADLLLKINVGGYSLEAANPRHEHEWKVWKDLSLPEGRVLYPGVINTKTNVVEHPEVVADRIIRYTEVVGRENVIASTDCGFIWRMHPQIAWAKMEALVEGARLATKTLFNS